MAVCCETAWHNIINSTVQNPCDITGNRGSVDSQLPLQEQSLKQRSIVVSVGFIATVSNAWAAAVSDYPARPIRLIVPIAAGGSVDIAARNIAARLSDAMGQQVVVDNRTGAGGTIGADIAAKSAPDGYTMVMGSSSTFGVNPTLYRKIPYDAIRDFAPVSMVSYAPNVLVLHPSVPAKSIKELIALARAQPGKLNFASSGTGGSPHLAGELFKLVAKVDITHIPYKGTGQSVADLIGGQVQMSFGSVIALLQYIKTDRLRPLAVTTAKRVTALPDVQTFAEAGYPGMEITAWNGILVPAVTPKPVVQKLNREIVKILSQPEVKAQFLAQGAETGANSPEEFAAYIRNEIEKWGRVVKAAGLRVD